MIKISDLNYLEAAPKTPISGSAGWGSPSGNALYAAWLQYPRLGRTATASATSLALSNPKWPRSTFTQATTITRVSESGSYSSSSSIAIVGS
ncbi:MAG: hypothetical protein HC857_01545 [Synechococcales cyanobacterium RU_4_20]|nr:hypothetical protein [Synechococcales cyanobacterium RU_4_20]NJR68628.1 hypothetical protein [Synechococcales cyanobacterium CRU_2_2]